MRGALITFIVLAGAPVIGQEPAPPKLTFDVASIRPQSSSVTLTNLAGTFARVRPGGGFSGTHATVASLIMFAYDLKDYQIAEGPGWIRESYFDINARAERPDARDEDIRLMVRSLLEDRFGLVAHMEPREMRFQALVRARPDGPLGPQLLPIDECSSGFVNELRRKDPDTYTIPLGGGIMAGCTSPGATRLADSLTLGLGAPVIDETGLTGSFYYTIRSQFSVAARFFGGARTDLDGLPALPTALEEQLGLRLESRRGPFQVLVIDSVQQPTEN
jgi:uncharacterized protein (TIGR03435 family)